MLAFDDNPTSDKMLVVRLEVAVGTDDFGGQQQESVL